MKTATFLIAALLVMAPFHAQAAPTSDYEKQVSALQTQIQKLQMQLAKLTAGAPVAEKEVKSEVKKEKKLKAKTLKRMDEKVAALDAAWAEREAELDAKYKNPGKWKLVDDKALREFKKYEEKRASLLLGQ